MTGSSTDGRKRHGWPTDVHSVCEVLARLAPLQLAESWDNVGLLAGDPAAGVKHLLLCIDLTPDVVDEAVAAKLQMVVAYHPPIFKPIARLVEGAPTAEAGVHRCIAHGIAIYSPHTALDAADGGTNDCLAELCGVRETQPLEWVDGGPAQCKLVTFVPANDLERVADALFAAGAGHIGDYEKCSFRVTGTGTFFGTAAAHPVVGQAGQLERVDEIRLEVVCPAARLAAAVAALVLAHPYEEPAFDVYPLQRRPTRGTGRVGLLRRPLTLSTLARKVKRAVGADCTTIVGESERRIERAIVAVGAAGSMPFQVPLGPHDVVITGEIRHHDALAIRRRDCSAIALGHWSSERPVLPVLADRLRESLPGVDVSISGCDSEPFRRA